MVSISEPQPPRLGAKLLALLGTAGALGACGAYPEDGDKEPALAVVTVSFDAPLAGAVRGVRIRATQPACGLCSADTYTTDGTGQRRIERNGHHRQGGFLVPILGIGPTGTKSPGGPQQSQ